MKGMIVAPEPIAVPAGRDGGLGHPQGPGIVFARRVGQVRDPWPDARRGLMQALVQGLDGCCGSAVSRDHPAPSRSTCRSATGYPADELTVSTTSPAVA